MSTLVRAANFRPFWDIRNDFDDIINGFFTPAPAREGEVKRVPALDVVEKEDRYLVTAELPGVDRKDVEISVDDGVLKLSAKVEAEHVDETANVLRRERRYGEYARALSLGEEVNADAIEANFTNGVLTITLPKIEKREPLKIEVN